MLHKICIVDAKKVSRDMLARHLKRLGKPARVAQRRPQARCPATGWVASRNSVPIHNRYLPQPLRSNCVSST